MSKATPPVLILGEYCELRIGWFWYGRIQLKLFREELSFPGFFRYKTLKLSNLREVKLLGNPRFPSFGLVHNQEGISPILRFRPRNPQKWLEAFKALQVEVDDSIGVAGAKPWPFLGVYQKVILFCFVAEMIFGLLFLLVIANAALRSYFEVDLLGTAVKFLAGY